MKKNVALYALIIASAVGTRLMPHAWNFAPVTAIAIVTAVYLPLRQAIALSLVIRFISDAIIGFFSWPLMLVVYLSHLFGVLMGLWVRKFATSPLPSPLSERVPEGRVRLGMWPRVVVAPVVSSLVFFLVTNFAFFYPTYTHDISGVILAYAHGLPFLRGTLLGDVGYTIAFVASFEAVRFYLRHRAAGARLGFKTA